MNQTKYIVQYRTSETHNAIIFNTRREASEWVMIYLNDLCWPYTAPLTMLIDYARKNKIAFVEIIEDI